MNFAINYSHEAAALLQQGRIQVDRFKCPDWPEMVSEALQFAPVAIHFNFKVGAGSIQEADWFQVEALLEQTGTPFVNVHLHPTTDDYPDIPVDTNDPRHVEWLIAQLVTDIDYIVSLFGAERVIAENVPYTGLAGKILRPVVEPSVIRQVLLETGCNLLLDISHARIAAHFLGMDEKDYFSQLPVNRLRELHFTGLHWRRGHPVDHHLEALEADWIILEWVLSSISAGVWSKPWLLAYEYGGVGDKFAWRRDENVIASHAPLLYKLSHNLNSSL